MKAKLLVGLLVVLGGFAVVLLVVWPRGRHPSGTDVGSDNAGSRGSSLGDPGAGPGPRGGEPKVLRPTAGGGGHETKEQRSAVEPGNDDEVRPDLGEPHEPANRGKLAAQALVRQRDLIKTQLQGLQERVPKLKSVLARLRRSGEGSPQALQQIQTQLQQSADAITRLERKLPELEAQVAKLPRPDAGTPRAP